MLEQLALVRVDVGSGGVVVGKDGNDQTRACGTRESGFTFKSDMISSCMAKGSKPMGSGEFKSLGEDAGVHRRAVRVIAARLTYLVSCKDIAGREQ